MGVTLVCSSIASAAPLFRVIDRISGLGDPSLVAGDSLLQEERLRMF